MAALQPREMVSYGNESAEKWIGSGGSEPNGSFLGGSTEMPPWSRGSLNLRTVSKRKTPKWDGYVSIYSHPKKQKTICKQNPLPCIHTKCMNCSRQLFRPKQHESRVNIQTHPKPDNSDVSSRLVVVELMMFLFLNYVLIMKSWCGFGWDAFGSPTRFRIRWVLFEILENSILL